MKTNTNTEVTRAVRAVLKKALPDVKFSVSTSYDVQISWDDGPERTQIETVLIEAGLAEDDRTVCALGEQMGQVAAKIRFTMQVDVEAQKVQKV